MTTIAESAISIARCRGWTCEKLHKFFEHCAYVGYKLDAEDVVIGSALLGTMRGFGLYVWKEEPSTIDH